MLQVDQLVDRIRTYQPSVDSDLIQRAYDYSYRMHAGHQLRLQVSGGAFPRYARNHGTGEPFGAAVTTRRCQFEVFADAQHQGYVELPLDSSS